MALLCLGGCGGEPEELGPPPLGEARVALGVALDAWKAGDRGSGVVVGKAPAVGVVDAARAARPLRGYHVEGPLMVVEKGRPFAVRLDLGEPDETVEARYVVLGRDPLWVFRQADLDRMLHWEHADSPR